MNHVRIAITGCIVLALALIVIQFARSKPPSANQKIQKTVHWKGLSLRIPHDWKVANLTADYGAWRSENNSRSVTLSAVPAADEPLQTVVRATEMHLQKLAGYKNSTFAVRGNQVRHTFDVVGQNGAKIRVIQEWSRLDQGLDSIVTWTRSI